MWASRSKPKKALDLHPTAGILLQSLVFFPQRCRNHLLQPSASSGAVLRSSAKRYPADSQAIPPLRTTCYSLPSVGPPRTRTVKFPTPLHLRLHCRVFPISGSFQSRASPSSTSLGSLVQVWSTWSIIESHRKMDVRERLTVGTHHAHGCMHATASFLP